MANVLAARGSPSSASAARSGGAQRPATCSPATPLPRELAASLPRSGAPAPARRAAVAGAAAKTGPNAKKKIALKNYFPGPDTEHPSLKPRPGFFFSAPFCLCKLKRVQVPVPTAAYAASHASRTGREAAGLRSLLPASVCQELVQSWRRASSSKLRLEG